MFVAYARAWFARVFKCHCVGLSCLGLVGLRVVVATLLVWLGRSVLFVIVFVYFVVFLLVCLCLVLGLLLCGLLFANLLLWVVACHCVCVCVVLPCSCGVCCNAARAVFTWHIFGCHCVCVRYAIVLRLCVATLLVRIVRSYFGVPL